MRVSIVGIRPRTTLLGAALALVGVMASATTVSWEDVMCQGIEGCAVLR